jgi:hypothetical protein
MGVSAYIDYTKAEQDYQAIIYINLPHPYSHPARTSGRARGSLEVHKPGYAPSSARGAVREAIPK